MTKPQILPKPNKLRGVAIGAGYFSQFQYEAWQRLPEVEIVAAYNRTREKIEETQAKFGIPRVYAGDELERMLDEAKPDFVDVITPPSTHLDICQLAFDRGLHVICQKPLAPTYAESVELVRRASQSSGRFMVHENWRWQPWYREIKRIIESGQLGEVFTVASRMRMGDGWGEDAYLSRQPFFRDYPRLLMFETGVHFLDAYRYLLGEVDSLYAQLDKRNPVIKGEDSGIVICNFQSGTRSLFDANRYNEADTDNPRYTFGALRIDGSEGHLELDLDGGLALKPLGQPSRKIDYTHNRAYFGGDCVFNLQRHFVECMLSGEAFESSGEDYLKTVKLVEACYASAADNRVIEIDRFNP